MRLGALFFDFGKIEMKATGEKSFQIEFVDHPKDFKNFYILMRGSYACLLVLSGANNVESEITQKPWMGSGPNCIITYRFE